MNFFFKNSFYFFLFSFFLSHISIYGQENSYINFSVADGLPSSEVYHVIQDKKGFIWFATDNGVVKFDGGNFEVFNSTQGLSDPVVFGFHEDGAGRIWFRTFTGKLSYYLNGKVHKYIYNDSIVKISGKNIVSDIYYDSLDRLWFTAGNQISIIDKFGYSKTEIIPSRSIVFRPINNQKDMLAFSGPTQQINTIKIDDHFYAIHSSDTIQPVGLICSVRWRNHKFFSINKDLFEYNNGLKKVYTTLTPIISLSVDKENSLWIGSINGGVQRIEDTSFKEIFTINELNGKSVSKVIDDDEKGFWISTLEMGVFYFPNFSINKFNHPANSKISSVNSIEDKIITTNYSGKVTAYGNPGNQILWELDLGLPITSSYITKLNEIWVSTIRETFILNDNGKILKRNLPSSFVDFSSTSSNIYGVSTQGLYKFNLEGKLLSNKKLSSQFRNILTTGNDIYMGGKNGMFLFDSLFNYVKELKVFTDIKVTNIVPIKDSILLISTIGNGFILFDKNQNKIITSYNSTKDFIANNIYSVLQLDSMVWLGTEKGIAVANIKSLLSGNPMFNFIRKRNGLVSDKVNFLASRSGEILAFCDEGYTLLPINQLRYIKQRPTGYIKEIRMNDSFIDFQNSLDFNYQQNNIQIKIGFLNFDNQNILARYRIAPSDPWISSDNWTFAFNALSPGQYTFQIECSIDNLNWFPAMVDLNFKINPPWWNTWYTRFAFGLIVLLVGIFISRRRIIGYKEKNKYLGLINEQQKKLLNAEIEATERERSRIAKDLHDGIGMDLVSIKLMANQIAKNTEDQDALKIQSQLQKTISEIQNIIYGLTPSGLKLFGLSYGLENYIAMVSRNHPAIIKLDVQGKEIKDSQIGAMIYRIIQELITNSIKHSRCEKISIYIKVFINAIQITYRDNGIGFNPENVKQGLGLSNIQSRVEALGGQLNFESGSTGTSYSINLPLKGDRK